MRLFTCVVASIICFSELKVISGFILNATLSFRVIVPKNGSISKNCSNIKNETLTDNGYTYTPGIGSHKLHIYANTWNEARKICNIEKAHLAVINSEAEEAVLMKMLARDADKIVGADWKFKEAYLGIHDLYFKHEWVTISGQSLYTTGYEKWSKTWYGGQPNNFGGNQHCVTLLSIGGMNDLACHKKIAFFCERPIAC